MSELPQVERITNADEYNRVVDRANGMLARLKPMDYDALKLELRQLNFSMSESPSLQQLNMEIQKIQAAKDRITEIMMDATSDFIMKTRLCDVLVEGWQRYSSESSADKRKADAAVRFSQFVMMSAEAEAFYKTVMHVLKNLDFKHESASRRVTCFSLTLKLRDISRGTPDQDYFGAHEDKVPNGLLDETTDWDEKGKAENKERDAGF